MIGILDDGKLICPISWADVLLIFFRMGYTLEGNVLTSQGKTITCVVPAEEPTKALDMPEGIIVLPVVEVPATIGDGQMSGGWKYDVKDTTIEHQEIVVDTPAPPVFVPPPLTRLEFLNRFTTEELVTLKTVEATDPVIGVFWEQIRANLADERTAAGVQYCVSKNYLTAARAEEILG